LQGHGARPGRPATGRYRVAQPPALRKADPANATTPAEYHGFQFWVFDVCESILFAEMAAVASQAPAADRSGWLATLEHELRVHAIVGANFAILLDEWCDGHEEEFLALVTEAARRLAERGTVTAQQAADWIVLDGKPIIWRGPAAVSIDAIVAFAEA